MQDEQKGGLKQIIHSVQKSYGRQSAIAWQVSVEAYQPLTDCLSREKNAADNGLDNGSMKTRILRNKAINRASH